MQPQRNERHLNLINIADNSKQKSPSYLDELSTHWFTLSLSLRDVNLPSFTVNVILASPGSSIYDFT